MSGYFPSFTKSSVRALEELGVENAPFDMKIPEIIDFKGKKNDMVFHHRPAADGDDGVSAIRTKRKKKAKKTGVPVNNASNKRHRTNKRAGKRRTNEQMNTWMGGNISLHNDSTQGMFLGAPNNNNNSSSSSSSDSSDDEEPVHVFAADLCFEIKGLTRNYKVFVIDDGSDDIQEGIYSHMLKNYYIDEFDQVRPLGDPNITGQNFEKQTETVDYTKIYDRKMFWKFDAWCTHGVDYIDINKINSPEEIYYEIGASKLRQLCKEAEDNDYEFAQNIQGLLGVLPHIVWACLDPDYYSKDRQLLLKAFLTAKAAGAAKMVYDDPQNFGSALTAHELLRIHKTFTREWVRKHYKYLTPYITSACIMLMEKCKNALPRALITSRFKPLDIARIIWRNKKLQTIMLDALYWQITNLENTKGGRNPSYKQMSSTTSSYTQSYYSFYRALQAFKWSSLELPDEEYERLMHPLVIDWYGVIGQLPEIHKHYTRMWTEKQQEHFFAMNAAMQENTKATTVVDGMQWNVINPGLR